MAINFVPEILTGIVTSIVTCSAIIWLSKTWITVRLKEAIKNEYAHKLEGFKNELKYQSELNIEKLKYQINISSLEHQIKFTKLHDSRVYFIVELYAMIQALGLTASSVIQCIEGKPALHKPDRLNNLVDETNKFKLFYRKYKIYFKKEICTNIDLLCKECDDIFNKLQPGTEQEVDLLKIKQINDNLNLICGKIQIKIPEITNELEDHFKKLLGVEKEELSSVNI